MNNELYHHGVKGMRWGIRKKQDTSSGNGKIKTKSKHYDKLYQTYKDKGYSDEAAKNATEGRMKTEKALAIVGGVAVASLIAYGTYRYIDDNVDKTIKAGKLMQTVHMGDAQERIQSGKAFYATFDKKDNLIYSSKMFGHFSADSKITKFTSNSDIKVASEKTAKKIAESMVKNDPELKRLFMSNGKFNYSDFNYALVKSDVRGVSNWSESKKNFYDMLKNKGYGALIDTNDAKNDMHSFKPMIVFSDAVKTVKETRNANGSDLSDGKLGKAMTLYTLRSTALNPVSTLPGQAAVGSGALAVNAIISKQLAVNNYRNKHPKTKMTDKEISKMLSKIVN